MMHESAISTQAKLDQLAADITQGGTAAPSGSATEVLRQTVARCLADGAPLYVEQAPGDLEQQLAEARDLAARLFTRLEESERTITELRHELAMRDI